jgi:hypothetical protein
MDRIRDWRRLRRERAAERAAARPDVEHYAEGQYFREGADARGGRRRG